MNKKQIQNIPYFISILAITYVLNDPGVLVDAAEFHDYLPIKFVLSVLLVKNFPYIKKRIAMAKKSFKCESDTFYDIPVGEMADYIMKGKYKSPEIVELFGLSHNKAQKAGKELDKMGIFERDSNNGRVLADITRSEVVALLKGKKPLQVQDYTNRGFNGFFTKKAL